MLVRPRQVDEARSRSLKILIWSSVGRVTMLALTGLSSSNKISLVLTKMED